MRQCLIGTLIDLRRFTVPIMQRFINRAWNLRDRVTVVGRKGNHYIFHFNPNDLNFMLLHGPWSIEGALLVLELCRQNTTFSTHTIIKTPIWGQLWGLPLEYQQPNFAQRISQTIGHVTQVDWENVIPRNIRFMRVKVWMEPNSPSKLVVCSEVMVLFHGWSSDMKELIKCAKNAGSLVIQHLTTLTRTLKLNE